MIDAGVWVAGGGRDGQVGLRRKSLREGSVRTLNTEMASGSLTSESNELSDGHCETMGSDGCSAREVLGLN